jgi:hypothetical protein
VLTFICSIFFLLFRFDTHYYFYLDIVTNNLFTLIETFISTLCVS